MSGGDGNRTDEIDLRFLKAAVEAAGNTILIKTACLGESDPKIVYVNPAFTRLSGYEEPNGAGEEPPFPAGGELGIRFLADRAPLPRFPFTRCIHGRSSRAERLLMGSGRSFLNDQNGREAERPVLRAIASRRDVIWP